VRAIEEKLEDARRNLLDLTFRNRLIHYRPARARSLRIVDEDPREVFDLLVLQGRRMRFLPRRLEAGAMGPPPSSGDDPQAIEGRAPGIWALPPEDAVVSDDHADLLLQTLLEPEALQERLFYIAQESRTVFEEQGYTVLYLAAGFLEWSESPGGEIRKAPLILIPVECERDRVLSSFKLAWTGEDIITNISLQEKLRECHAELPPFEMPEVKDGIDHYLQTVDESIRGRDGWRITVEIHLDLFTFSSFVMYRDLDPAAWPGESTPARHPIIAEIFGNGPQEAPAPAPRSRFPEEEIDTRLPAGAVYHVLDADSSQIAAIEDLKAGMNLVIEGPPGTGKSQTIANLIAEFLANGKTVLFVSEKMAALDVVKRRLDDLGLGTFCLELHNRRKANKRKVLAELQQALGYQLPPAPVDDDRTIREVEELRAMLNEYAAALRTSAGGRSFTPFQLYGMWDTAQRVFRDAGRTMPHVEFEAVEAISALTWTPAVNAVKELDSLLPSVAPVDANPWRFCSPGALVASDPDEIRNLLREALARLEAVRATALQLAEYTGLSEPETPADLVRAVRACDLLAPPGPIDPELLLGETWNTPSAGAETLIRTLETYRALRAALSSRLHPRVFSLDLDRLAPAFESESRRLLRSLYGPYRTLRAEIEACYRAPRQRTDAELLADLAEARRCRALEQEVDQASGAGRALFGPLWRGGESDPETLRTFSDWIVRFRQALLAGVLTRRTVERLAGGIASERLRLCATNVEDARTAFETVFADLLGRLHADRQRCFPDGPEETPLEVLQAMLETWSDRIGDLVPWSYYALSRADAERTLAAPIVPLAETGGLLPGELLPCLEAQYAAALIRSVFERTPALERFVGIVHEQRIGEFADLDRRMILANRGRLARRLSRARPAFMEEASGSSELGVLRTEFNRKRGHLPIRQLLVRAGGPIQRIKPCFMMSPPSIAQFLDPRSIQFDLVVFDEASQVRPADALGALLRGRQVAVIGDSRQLPPTSFFERIVAALAPEEEEEDAMPSEMESILNLCRTRFPVRTLRWHYRSRHDSLIALSNREFYDDQLYVYPSPRRNVEELGLKFVHLPETVYDRGKSATNRGEARAVAEAVMDHARRFPSKSLGIGAFNIQQQGAILEELERLRGEQPDLEPFFDTTGPEPFFVKNLETIQGDERDVIFLSIGYGFDARRRLTTHFGALNREGGERRLNVLITRARERCVVFANFRAHDLPLADLETASRGVAVLRLFLEYAETGRIPCTTSLLQDPASPFEETVSGFLTRQGHTVHRQVGCAGFRLDLAVVRPDRPGEYLIGVICDGPMYHTSRVSRDRDRLRNQVLEGLGWRIVRCWSTDWFRNPAASREALLAAIERARAADSTTPAPQQAPVESGSPIEAPARDPGEGSLPGTVPPPVLPYGGPVWAGPYVPYAVLPVPKGTDPGQYPPLKMGALVAQVVETEGPVHIEVVVRRIRDACGAKRATPRIRGAIEAGVEKAVEHWGVERRGEFLWPRERPRSLLRHREGATRPRLELICDEEIEEAVLRILERQFATDRAALATGACREVGVQRPGDEAEARAMRIIDGMVARGAIAERPNGLIDLAPPSPR
jgi:very-short-patch-repair endonuclease